MGAGQGENSAATLLQGGEGRVGVANGRGSPWTASFDAGAGAVVQGGSESGRARHVSRFERRRRPSQSGEQLRLGDGAIGTEETSARWRRSQSSS
jgi:hypothetical protein